MDIETGFAENDELWHPVIRETPANQAIRAKIILDDIFNNDNSTFVSLTTHSGTIRALLEVVGHRKWNVPPGGLLPVFVRAEWYEDWELEKGPEPPPAKKAPTAGTDEGDIQSLPADPYLSRVGGEGSWRVANHISDESVPPPG